MSTTELPARDDPATALEKQNHRPVRRRRTGRARTLVVLLVVMAVAAAGVAVYLIADPFGDRAPAATTATTTTGLAPVEQGDLSERSMQNGTLGYAGSYEVVNKASGTLTQAPAVGDVVKQGRSLYRVDGEPVVWLRGRWIPVYRELSWGTEGVDVKQLNAALVALGHAKKSVLDPDSDYFGRATYNAVLKLQDDVGMEETGTLELGQVLFVPADEIRITEVSGVAGTSVGPNAVVVKASSTKRQITVALNASQQGSVAVNDDVTITMPNGKSTKGRVSSVGKVATKTDSSTTIEVLIEPSKPKDTGDLDQAPVQVSIVSDTVEDVLSVPVNALLALAGGGYAVEVVDAAGGHTLIPVERGLFDDSAGRVEVTGPGLAAGQNVVVPAS